MFWGLIMEPERRYTQNVKRSFHISMASLDIDSSADEPTQVMVGYEGRNYLLCTLKKPDIIQCPLDLEFAAGSEISLASNGKAHVHLTGYLTDDLALADLEEQEEEEEELEEVEDKKKKRKKDKKQSESPAKKAKLMNGLSETIEEEESDDPDFEEEEEEEVEGEDDDDDEVSDDDLEEVEEEEEDEEEADEEEEEEEKVEPEVPQKLSKKEKKQLKLKQQNGEQKKKTKEETPQKQKQTLAKGVVVEDLVVGSGPVAKAGKFINVYYEGRLQQNNKMFDSSTKGPGFKFRLGAGEVIKGWDIGLAGMKVGGKRKITCPPHAAYGHKGSPPVIPPNSTLVFTVELKKVN